MEKKDILIKYGVDPGNTSKAMNDIAKASAAAGGSLDKTGVSMRTNTQLGMNFNRVLQDSPYFFSSFNMGVMSVANNLPMLAESFQQARARGESFKTMMAGMFTGMGGWITALNLAISGILAYTIATRDAEKETSKLEESTRKLETAFNSLVKVENPLQGLFSLDASNIKDMDKLIDKLKSLTGETQSKQAGQIPGLTLDPKNAAEYNRLMAESFTKMSSKSGEYSEGVKKRLENLKTELEFQKELSKIIEEIGIKKTVKENGKTSGKTGGGIKDLPIGMGNAKEWAELEKYGDEYRERQRKQEEQLQREKINAVNDYYNRVKFSDSNYEAYRIQQFDNELNRLRELGFAEDELNNIKKMNLEQLEADKMAYARKMNAFENHFANAAASTLRTGMNQAFDDIFGHANSLLEIFLQNLVSGMTTDLATQAGEGIFSWLTGGVSSIFSGLFSMQGGGNSKEMSKVTINLDGKMVAESTKPYYREMVYDLERTGRW